MKLILELEIICAERTCGIGNGRFCRFFHYDLKGDIWCHLFGYLNEVDGWSQRAAECILNSKVQANEN